MRNYLLPVLPDKYEVTLVTYYNQPLKLQLLCNLKLLTVASDGSNVSQNGKPLVTLLLKVVFYYTN